MKWDQGWVVLALLVAAWLVVHNSRETIASDHGLQQGSVVAGDVLLPMPEMIRRFQEPLPRMDALGDGAAESRDALVDAFVAAVEDSSAARLRSLRLDAAEFGWLYFPESRYTAKPYELPPETLWMLIDQNGLKGETRLLRRFGGASLEAGGYTCEPEPRREGPNTYWEQCTLEIRTAEGQRTMRLFGSIMERDGRFKFVSMANDL